MFSIPISLDFLNNSGYHVPDTGCLTFVSIHSAPGWSTHCQWVPFLLGRKGAHHLENRVPLHGLPPPAHLGAAFPCLPGRVPGWRTCLVFSGLTALSCPAFPAYGFQESGRVPMPFTCLPLPMPPRPPLPACAGFLWSVGLHRQGGL